MTASLLTWQPTLAFLGLPGGSEWIIILIVGLLIFGRRLPEVGRSLGRSIVEFKKGIKGIEDEIEGASNESSSPSLSSSAANEPLKPYDQRLGGNEEELRGLQQPADPAPASRPAPDSA